MMKSILFFSCFLACILIYGCKDEKTAPAANAPASPAAPAVPPQAAPAPQIKAKPDLPQLLKTAETVCKALAAKDISFDVEQATETLRQLQEIVTEQDARNAVTEIKASLWTYAESLFHDNGAGLPPDIRIQKIAEIMPLLKIMGKHEYKEAQFRIKVYTEILIQRLEQAYATSIWDEASLEHPKQMLLTGLAVFDQELLQLASDFWDAEKSRNFAECVAVWEKTKLYVEKQTDKNCYERVRNFMESRLRYWQEYYRNEFHKTSDLSAKKAALEKLKPLYAPDNREFIMLNQEYRKRVEQESRQQPHQTRPRRPRSRAEAEEMRARQAVYRVFLSGQVTALDQMLGQGTRLDNIRINGKTPYTFLLDNIQRGRRVEQNRAMIGILLRHSVKMSDAEAARVKEVMPENPVPAK